MRLIVPAIALVLLGTLLYAWLIEPHQIEVSQQTLSPKGAGDRPIRIVQLSDLHLQALGTRERAVAAEVMRLTPDLVVLSGDVIDRPEALKQLDEFLSMLGGLPKVAVLGNWEYWSGIDLQALRSLYEVKHGVKLLVNAETTYRFGSRTISVMGVDDFTAGSPEISTTTPLGEELRLIVQHSPGWFESKQVVGRNKLASLCLSGHTHGGQVTFLGEVLWTPRGSGRFTGGLYELPMCPLYVSRGIGTSILPFRLGARPEIVLFLL